ncbi:MAG: (2Fe-2S)-binding protein, partial [Actinobacteria bacterium]|nr:(2Fe-2S)-binding protein [Actinomycetota bacterium]
MSDAPNRLSAPAGSRIDRARQIRFTFDGRAYEGYAGDTVASALAAHGVFLLSRSFKYHRPRGSLGFAGEEAGALVQVGDDPNVLADVRTLAPGLDVRGQNYVGSLRGDWAAALGLVRRFLPVGFYYKAFYRPKGIWKYWERVIRASAGLGRINPHAPHGAFDHAHDFCDVAVIGGGPAGLTAALEAAQAGAEVLLVEREPAVGGALSYARFDPAGARAAVELDALVKRVGPHRNLRIMTRATCTGYFADNWLAVTQGNRLTKVRAAAVVVATGCLDQPAVFRHNDLPGILLASGVQRLLRLYGVAPGRRIVVLTASDDGYASALDLAEHQLELAAIVDLRPQGPPGPFERAAGVRGLRTLHRHTVREAIRRPDGQRLGAVRVTHITGPGHCAPTGDELACDALCVATGAAPAASLLWQAGATFAYDETSATLALRSIPPGVFAAGSVAGHHALDAVLADGRRAGWAAAARAGFERALEPPAAASGPAGAQAPPRPIFPHPGGHDYVDLDEDIEAGDIAHAIAEGFTHGELVKRYTGLGMGPSQGRQSALAALQVTAHELGVPIAHVGTTTSRPPAYPEKFGHLAGRGFAPVRHTPLHQRHAEAGAQMMVAGLWIRPAYYGPASEREALIREEVLAVRHNVGLIDVSTLGGYEIRGPAAAEFLERMYTLAYRRQTVGRVRYALMTDEA